ncbi:hypothetical protein, partial [Campylobacter vulpis]|uniref:hypothetical protein n=1 Tax=Campylobacter vulpis TaxID=1655500 RepID=UPI001BCD8E3B
DSNGSGGSSGTTTPGIKVTGNIASTSKSAAALGNGGTINGGIVVENNAILTGGKNLILIYIWLLSMMER